MTKSSAVPKFTHVVPLGISCCVTYQVRVCFGSWKVYPFDWWITPLAGLTRYLAAPDIGKLYAAAAERHEKCLRRLLRLNRRGNRILFVRHQYGGEPGVKSGEDPGQAVAAIWEVLRCNWGEADIRLLLVNFALAGSLPEGVLRLDFAELPGPPRESWRGDEEQWQRNFSARGLALRPRPHIHLKRSPGPPD